jgi:hypothetical protein
MAIPLSLNKFLNTNTRPLCDYIINSGYTITVVPDHILWIKHWRIVIEGLNATIYTHPTKDEVACFAHEILHIEDILLGETNHIDLCNQIKYRNEEMKSVFVEQDVIDNITNSLSHTRGLQRFENLNFRRDQFLGDWYKKYRIPELDLRLRRMIINNRINIPDLRMVLIWFIAYRFIPPPSYSKSFYNKTLYQKIRKTHPELYSIIQTQCVNWESKLHLHNIDFITSLIVDLEAWKIKHNFRLAYNQKWFPIY